MKISCGGSVATTGITYNGAQFRAAWNTSDFALMEMDDSPLGDERFAWLGWDRSGTAPTSGTGIHHPSGDVMKISFDNDAIPETVQGSTSGGINHWYVDIDDGTLEHGSSGSPLFNQDDRVVGQLHSGYPGCHSSNQFWYGCFHRSWTGGGTNTTRLSNWLDPCSSGTITTNTTRSPLISGPTLVCTSGASYSITNLPPGATITWTQSANLSRSSAQGSNPCTFTATSSGTGWIGATITNGCGEVTLPRRDVYTSELPAPVLSGNYVVKCGYQLTYRVDDTNAMNGDSFYWDSDILSIRNETSPTCTVWGDFDGSGYISCTVTACGIKKTTTRNINVIMCDYLMISPNPSTNVTTISVEPSEEDIPDETTSWDLEVYDQSQALKAKKEKIMSRSTCLNTSGWKEGIYIVRALYNGEILTGKLVVKP